jgi:hypothetical protein
MISQQYSGISDWLDDLKAQGINPGEIWDTVKTNAKDLVLKDLPGAAVKTVKEKAAATAQPVVESVAQQKASRVVSKGNIALTAGIGLLAGFVVAGGSWQRRAVGAGVGGILGGLAGLKIGLVSDT